MAKKNQQSERFDAETGVVYSEPNSGQNRNFLMLFMEDVHLLSKIKGGEKPIRLFVYMIRHMNFDNVLSRTQVQIGYELELTRSYISRILTKFEKDNICVNGRGWYQINPDLIFYGRDHRKDKQHNVYRKRRFNKGLIHIDPELEKDQEDGT